MTRRKIFDDPKEAIRQYQKKNYRIVALHYDKVKDKTILDRIDMQENKANYIRTLIKKDIEESAAKQDLKEGV
jgi:hypothetical protein